MNKELLETLLRKVADGTVSVDEAVNDLRDLPFEDLGIARVDHHRALRQGVGEVIFGAGKTDDEILTISEALLNKGTNLLCTRISRATFEKVAERHSQAEYHERARCLTLIQKAPTPKGKIAVLSAGTSDLGAADEAAITARFAGAEVTQLTDVGVAGLHRLLEERATIAEVDVVIVVAGMEGALASVVGGLVAQPVIAVPTSVGYGSNLGGFTTLFAMLSACASGVSVVNIDNGFGAAMAAVRMLRHFERDG